MRVALAIEINNGVFFFSSRRRHTRYIGDWSSDVCSSDLGSSMRILIVEARFYAHLYDLLLAGARAAIEAAGHSHETVTVPGALEVPGAIALAAESGRYEAFEIGRASCRERVCISGVADEV